MKISDHPELKSGAHAWLWEELEAYLAKKNLKQTKQRQRIIELFLELNTHTSAESLHEAAKKDGQNIGLATVYRTLNMMADAGLVEQKSFGEDRHVFELKAPGQHHDHLICISCGTVIEFTNDVIEEIQEKVAKEHGFTLKSHRLDLYGHCGRETCRA